MKGIANRKGKYGAVTARVAEPHPKTLDLTLPVRSRTLFVLFFGAEAVCLCTSSVFAPCPGEGNFGRPSARFNYSGSCSSALEYRTSSSSEKF